MAARLRIGLDASPLVRPFPPGVVRVARHLTEALERRGKHEVVRLAPADGMSLRTWRRRGLPAAAKRERLTGIHSFLSAFPTRGPGRRVQTVHELPWKHGVRENADLAHRLWAALGPWRADRVVCPTQHVAEQLASGPFVSRAKLRVVPWGCDERFTVDPPLDVIDEAVLERYGLGQSPFLLVVGGTRAKKNVAALLAGLAAHRERDERPLHVVVSGPETADLRRDLGTASKLGLARWVSTPGTIDDADLPSLMRLAAAVPVLSRSEGFGLPALEALACGTPVLVPRGSAQAEVAGDAGIVVDADDPRAVADGIASALASGEAERYRRAEHARGFTWDAAAERVEALWEELA